MTGVATYVKTIPRARADIDARLYKVDPPIRYGFDHEFMTDHVVVSAANVHMSGPETYIFPADVGGAVLDWLELDGSRRGDVPHKEVLGNAGYEVSGD